MGMDSVEQVPKGAMQGRLGATTEEPTFQTQNIDVVWEVQTIHHLRTMDASLLRRWCRLLVGLELYLHPDISVFLLQNGWPTDGKHDSFLSILWEEGALGLRAGFRFLLEFSQDG